MPRLIALHKLDASRPYNDRRSVQPTICRTRARDPLVFANRNEAERVATAIPDGYQVCQACWSED